MLLLPLLQAAQDSGPDLSALSEWLRVGSGLGGTAMMLIGVWALYKRMVIPRSEYDRVLAERDQARSDVKTLTDGMMQEVIPLVTRQGDLLRAIEPRIQPTIRLSKEPGE